MNPAWYNLNPSIMLMFLSTLISWTSIVSLPAFNLKHVTGSALFAFLPRLDSGAWSREGQWEERQGSGARRRQEEIHHRVTSLTGPSSDSQPAKWSSTPAVPPSDRHTESDCLLRSCRGNREGRWSRWVPSFSLLTAAVTHCRPTCNMYTCSAVTQTSPTLLHWSASATRLSIHHFWMT